MPLLIRVHTTLLASMCCANAFFSLCSEKKHFLWCSYPVVENKSKCGLSWSILLLTMSMHHYSFPKQFFLIALMLSKFAKVFERKVWCVQVAHLHNAGHALSSPSQCFQLSTNRDKDFFPIFDIVVKNSWMWFSVVCTLSTMIGIITVVKICCETILSCMLT